MIDVSPKFNTLRYAKAEGILKTTSEIVARIRDRQIPKGDVLQVARAAGISAAKRSADWIVFCHPIPLDWVEISYELGDTEIAVSAEVRSVWKTGVEMEAMTAVSAALINMYDMLKPLTDDIELAQIRLVNKKGGKSDFKDHFDKPLRAAVVVLSDSTYEGKRQDKSGIIIQEILQKQGIEIADYIILPDDYETIKNKFVEVADSGNVDLLISTGGTGIGPKDMTPEVTREILDKEMPGIAEAIRKHGKDRTPYAMHSRELAGIRGKTMIINLPGSSRGSKESLEALFPGLLHAFPMLWGGGHNH